MAQTQIFDASFETSWKEFDESFRKLLLKRIQEMGSLHRMTLSRDEADRETGRRFYEALEEALTNGKFIDKWKKALAISMPTTFDELSEQFKIHELYPLHAFFLLLIFLHDYPLRAFFSGRDEQLPYNTLTIKFDQALGDSLPSAVRYELEMINLDRCPGLIYEARSSVSSAELSGPSSPINPTPPQHPRNHRWDLTWVWHF